MLSELPSLEAGPLPAYREMVATGALQADNCQAMAAERLQYLWSRLKGYDPPATPRSIGLFDRLLGRRAPEATSPVAAQGFYMVGEVGRGKSMLMDLFFEAAQLTRKRRIHFHRFMQEAHARVHEWKKQNPDGSDPIGPLADRIAGEAALLCFDEFQVNDIADAMILGRLFEALFARSVVVVATSNTAPGDLFKGRPGRDAFLPFIRLIEAKLDVLVLEGERDYRRARLHGMQTWYVPADGAADLALDEAFRQLAGHDPVGSVDLHVTGRILHVPICAGGVARFDFAALCARALGAGEYLALATHFHALVLDGVPRLSPDNFDEARRFIVLIDALYEHRVKLVASAADVADRLYERGEGAKAFERTASRLEEMQSQEYLARAHLT